MADLTTIHKAMRFESRDSAGVGIYILDDQGCPRSALMQVEMTPTEMVELAHDLLTTARRLDAGEAYLARMTAPTDLTPEDEEAILSLLRRVPAQSLRCHQCGEPTSTLRTREWLQNVLQVCPDCAEWIDAENAKEPA